MAWPMLDLLPPEEQRQLLATSRRRRFSRGEVILHEGDPADSVHLITSGTAAVRVTTALGDTATLTVLGPGATFGEVALVAHPPVRSATVCALDPCETLSIHRHDFDALRRTHPQIERFLLRLLAEQVRRLTDQLLEALYLPADKRVLRHLADLATIYAEDADNRWFL